MKVLITGASGQLGKVLCNSIPTGMEIVPVDVGELDICDSTAVKSFVNSCKPDLIINAAAYTAVDQAESEPEAAMAVNRNGIANLAQAANEHESRVIHISTDFVFDGNGSYPYLPESPVNPLGVYGSTKAEGEKALREILPDRHVIVRTAWLYSPYCRNFMKTMLKLMAERDELRVVSDQIGTPTGANTLGAVLWLFATRENLSGTYHCTDAGVASWYDFAQAIREEGENHGFLNSDSATVLPVRTVDYPTPARRPSYSVLDKTSLWHDLNIAPMHWRQNLRRNLIEYQKLGGGL